MPNSRAESRPEDSDRCIRDGRTFRKSHPTARSLWRSATAVAAAAKAASGGQAPTRSPQSPVARPRRRIARRPSHGTIDRRSARVGVTYDYQPEATDPEGDALRFSAASLPPWASMDPTTGRITGTPGENDSGIYESITIIVADATHAIVSSAILDHRGERSRRPVPAWPRCSWEMPPSKVDGSPLDDLAGYRILYGHDSARSRPERAHHQSGHDLL